MPSSPTVYHTLYPVICATGPTALRNLSSRLHYLLGGVPPSAATEGCFSAFGVLAVIANDVISATSSPRQSACNQACLSNQHRGALEGISPWLRNWISHAHIEPRSTMGLMRVILSFISRTPPAYTDILMTVLEAIPMTATGSRPAESQDYMDDISQDRGFYTVEQAVAMEIYAHWLGFVTLLDEVWWVGDLAAEELGRVVGDMKARNLWFNTLMDGEAQLGAGGLPAHDERGWWPESMHRMAVELRCGTTGESNWL